MGKIRLEGLEFFAHHGVSAEEQRTGSRYTVDIILHTDFEAAAKRDELSGTVDYEEVYQVIASIMRRNARLLEYLAHKINQAVLASFKQVERVEVSISKHNPPIKAVCSRATIELIAER